MRWVSLAVQVLFAITLVLGAVVLAAWWSALSGDANALFVQVPAWLLTGMPFGYAAAALLALADAIQAAIRGDVRSLARGAVLAKVSAIPFFLVNFAGAVLIAVVALVRGGPLVAVVVPVMVAGTFCIMLTTSVYGVAALIRLRRDRAIGHGFLWPHLVLHVLFVLDVVSSIVVAMRIRRLVRAERPVDPTVPAEPVSLPVPLPSGLPGAR
ncbi:DUF6652 family protein [Agrococcus jejuensis]|uniref:Uncharacterized protein n=1 Tax=Agrococcus jejuensis TaxID=399736 RepID=A0A1G8D4M8_9MICO|nr:DUF6652 family protein [Agrococcus jejuensis]SDH52329.1 hypothetical protein SAMN04489720_1506 [Agrococcus jejuensis]